jgi:hypothetical protein
VAQFQTECPSLVESGSLPSQRAIVASRGSFRRKFGKELCAQPMFSNDERACGAHVHGIVDAQFLASTLGRKVLCPPTLIPRKKMIKAALPIVAVPKYRGKAKAVGPDDR